MHQTTVPQPIRSRQIRFPLQPSILMPLLRRFMPLISVLVFVIVWQIVVSLNIYPVFIVPAPLQVLNKTLMVLSDGTLLFHACTTFVNVITGLAVGLCFAIVLGYAIVKTPLLEDFLSPVIVAVQSAPVVAYAPLLVIWFGSGSTSKIVTSALIVFFPMLMNTIVGIRNVPRSLRELMLAMQATRWQTFVKLEIPSAMPILMSGLKISATLAVIGAVVGEFVSANAGLGFLINLARSQYDTSLVIVSVFALTLIARCLYGFVSIMERYVLSWQRHGQR